MEKPSLPEKLSAAMLRLLNSTFRAVEKKSIINLRGHLNPYKGLIYQWIMDGNDIEEV